MAPNQARHSFRTRPRERITLDLPLELTLFLALYIAMAVPLMATTPERTTDPFASSPCWL